MKYYNIDLTQFVPYGIPLNSTGKVESKNHINEFFLRGFENWYNQLFTVDDIGTLVRDYSRSCTAPYSLAACKYCTNDQLEKFIQGEGFVYYSANDHNVNARFVYDLFRYAYGTQEYLSSIAQYVSNNPDVDAEILYDGYDTYEYGIRLYGDILGSENVNVMIDRITEHLKILGTAHTTLQIVEFEDTSSEIDTYAACVGNNSCIYYDSYLKEIAPPVKPDLDIFNPEIPFCIENTGNLEITVKYATLNTNIKISSDNTTWSDYTSDSEIRLNSGDRVYIKSDYVEDTADGQHFKFIGADGIHLRARGNIASLIYGTNNAYVNRYTSTEQYCYNNLFNACKGLVQGPDLPATNLANNCYSKMFQNCDDLTQAPDLPATNLANNCYAYMFEGCSGLTQAPTLPATNLVVGCYYSMFRSCISLTRAPELPAALVKRACYTNMFNGCTSLNYIKCLATDMVANSMTGWVANVAATGTFECDNKKYFTLDSPNGIPKGWTITEINPDPGPEAFDPTIPFYIENIGDVPVEVGLYNNSANMQVRKNCKISYDLKTWRNYSLALAINPTDSLIGKITLTNKGDRVYIKADLNTKPSTSHYTHLTVLNSSTNTKIKARGNIASLNKGTDDAYKTNYLTADDHGYIFLFRDCTSLIQAPELPATTLMSNCYDSMFYNCTSLVNAPSLPATELSGACYANMFKGCTSLVNAPALPATGLSALCYYNMFGGCTSLIQAPELLASALTNYSYAHMFENCTSLNYIKCLATNRSAEKCTFDWVKGVTPTGNFYKSPSATWETGASGIPTGWTSHNA